MFAIVICLFHRPSKYGVHIVVRTGREPAVLPLRIHNPAAYAAGQNHATHANLPREERLTTATTDDDITAFLAVQEVALKGWDLVSGDSIDKRNIDKTELRRAAVNALCSSKQRRIRSRLNSAGGDLAFAVMACAGGESDATYRAVSRASEKYERLRIPT